MHLTSLLENTKNNNRWKKAHLTITLQHYFCSISCLYFALFMNKPFYCCMSELDMKQLVVLEFLLFLLDFTTGQFFKLL